MSLVCVPLASQLDLSNNSIGGQIEGDDEEYDEYNHKASRLFVAYLEGVQAIAGALRVNGALTKME